MQHSLEARRIVAFTREEDACILHNVLLIGKQGTWKHMVPGRTEKASKGRYHKILKKHVENSSPTNVSESK